MLGLLANMAHHPNLGWLDHLQHDYADRYGAKYFRLGSKRSNQPKQEGEHQRRFRRELPRCFLRLGGQQNRN